MGLRKNSEFVRVVPRKFGARPSMANNGKVFPDTAFQQPRRNSLATLAHPVVVATEQVIGDWNLA